MNTLGRSDVFLRFNIRKHWFRVLKGLRLSAGMEIYFYCCFSGSLNHSLICTSRNLCLYKTSYIPYKNILKLTQTLLHVWKKSYKSFDFNALNNCLFNILRHKTLISLPKYLFLFSGISKKTFFAIFYLIVTLKT